MAPGARSAPCRFLAHHDLDAGLWNVMVVALTSLLRRESNNHDVGRFFG